MSSTPTFDMNTVPEQDRQRVSDLILDPRIADAYVHRNIRGIEDFALLDAAIEDGENVILRGPTGSSKTTLFRAYAAARGLPFALVECNGSMDPGLIIGRTIVDADSGVPTFVDGELTLVVRYGGVGLLDELNMAHARIGAAYHQLLAVTRRMSVPENGETIRAGRGGTGETQPTLFGAAYNPRYQGTVRLNEAMSNRFAMQVDWDYEREVEAQLVDSERLLDLAQNIRSLAEIRTPVSTNALMEFERHAHRWNIDMAGHLFVSRFEDDERGPVNRALEASAAAIAAELGVQ